MSDRHDDFEGLLALSQSGFLSQAERDALEAHLAVCELCCHQRESMWAAEFALFEHLNGRTKPSALAHPIRERSARRMMAMGVPSPRERTAAAAGLRWAAATLAVVTLAGAIARVAARPGEPSAETATLRLPVLPHTWQSAESKVPEQPPAMRLGVGMRPGRGAGVSHHLRAVRLTAPPPAVLPLRVRQGDVLQRMFPRPFAVTSMPSFSAAATSRYFDGDTILKRASFPLLGREEAQGPALRLARVDLAGVNGVPSAAQFRMPPLTDWPLFPEDTRR